MVYLRLLFALAAFLGQGYGIQREWARADDSFRRPNIGNDVWRSEEERIVGRTAAGVGEFPFLVSLNKCKRQFCGGSIINAKWILTAAHCVERKDNTSLYIAAADYYKNETNDGQQTRNVSKVIMHEHYNTCSNENDIALLELSSSLDLSAPGVKTIKLSTGGKCETGVFTVAGWGRTESGGESSDYVQKVNVNHVSNPTCQQQHGGGIFDTNICAAAPGKDSCQGVSEGPLFHLKCTSKPVLVGVASWDKGCTNPKYAGVYTRVSKYLGWIKTKTGITL